MTRGVKPNRPIPTDLENRTFGIITVLCFHSKSKYQQLWWCVCKCKRSFLATRGNLLRPGTQSCGCIKGTHNRTGTPEYWSWRSMRDRCENPNCKAFPNYGGRGITICERWLSFVNFITDMGERPSDKYTLERIDNEKGYCLSNCKWATRSEQSKNKRDTVLITYNGETLCMNDWSKRLGCHATSLMYRLKHMSIEEAFTKPFAKSGPRKKK